MELRAGDRIRWTRNDPGSGLVNGQMAEVESIARDGVRFHLEDGSSMELANNDAQLPLSRFGRSWSGGHRKHGICGESRGIEAGMIGPHLPAESWNWLEDCAAVSRLHRSRRLQPSRDRKRAPPQPRRPWFDVRVISQTADLAQPRCKIAQVTPTVRAVASVAAAAMYSFRSRSGS